ncbi:hypothetical protein DRO51_02130 [Candidatus Bathyarchaeota archaeon]|nr:MAG: hypothetical protein DRO51_02130 [Candidatus Bathyarchaeota archaeon]
MMYKFYPKLLLNPSSPSLKKRIPKPQHEALHFVTINIKILQQFQKIFTNGTSKSEHNWFFQIFIFPAFLK